MKLQKLYSNYDYRKHVSCFSLILFDIYPPHDRRYIFWVSKYFFIVDAKIHSKELGYRKLITCFILETDKLLFSIL